MRWLAPVLLLVGCGGEKTTTMAVVYDGTKSKLCQQKRKYSALNGTILANRNVDCKQSAAFKSAEKYTAIKRQAPAITTNCATTAATPRDRTTTS